ncbi:unnamed protein product [Agarophyton chilense]
MDPTDPTHSSSIRTYSICAVLILAGIAVFASYLDAALHASLATAGEQIRNSSWALVTFFDASFGALFPVYYLFVRNGPTVFWVPSRVFALLWPFAANFALLWYVSYMILTKKDVGVALFPYSDGSRRVEVPMRTEGNRVVSQVVMGLSSMIIVILFCLSVWAFGRESMSVVLSVVASKRYKWITFTFLDSLGGLLFVAVYIVEREGGARVASVLWIAALVVLGNTVTYVYIILMAMEALHLDVPFSYMVLSTQHSLMSGPSNPHI